MDRLMPFDELNTLKEEITDVMSLPVAERKEYEDFFYDEVLDLLIMSYVFGNEAANDMLGFSDDKAIEIERNKLTESIDKKIAGKSWKERFSEYFENEDATAEDIMRVAETDSHRIYNEAIYAVGEAADSGAAGEKAKGVVMKTWETMLDDRVREQHQYLEHITIPFDSYFYTYDGQPALAPGMFGVPELDIGCRCRLRLSIE